MGGCATKPKVSKDDPDVKAKAPEPEPELPKESDAVDETKVPQHENPVDDDQPNKRRSLSLLFNKENDDTEVSKENEKTAVEESVKQETFEAEKPWEDSKSNEPIVKQESSKAEEEKLLNNEAAKQESPLIELEEKSSVQNESNKHVEEPTKVESINEKLIEEIRRIEPLKQEFVEAKETFSVETQNKESIKQEMLPGSTNEQPLKNGSKAEKSETVIEENTNTKVVPQLEEKLIEALLTDAGSVQKNITEEATSSREEKKHNEVEHASMATDVNSVKT